MQLKQVFLWVPTRGNIQKEVEQGDVMLLGIELVSSGGFGIWLGCSTVEIPSKSHWEETPEQT